VSGFTDQGFGYADYTSLGPAVGPAGGYFSNASKTAFARALMAGLDFDVSTNLKLELGYRYLNYGSIPTGGLNCLGGKSGGTFNTVNCSGGVANYVSFSARPHLYAAREASTSPNVTGTRNAGAGFIR
jgi:opacity protein-like surface antigen